MVIIMLAASLSVSYSPLNLVNTIGLRVSEDTVWLEDAVRDIKAVNSGSHIFVAGTRHDRVFVSAVAIYFLAGRISGTYYHDFYPGITTTAEVQQRIVADLNANDVRTVLVWKDPLPALPNNISSGVRILDDFLQSNFERIRASKRYDLLVRKASIDSVLR